MRLQVISALAALVAAVPVSAQQPVPPPARPVPSIVTTAQGEVRVAPDRAMIILGVETRAGTSQAAGAENARRQTAVIDTLKKLGIPAERIRSADYTVYPERVWDNEGRTSRITGYVARNTVEVRVDDLKKVGPVIDAALAKGANTMHSLQFESSKADSARREALAIAVRQARADADAMAAAAGRCIYDVIELSTSEMVRPVYRVMEMAAGRAQDVANTPIEPGEQTITVSVQGRWQLQSVGRTCQ